MLSLFVWLESMASNQPAINVVPPDGYVGEDFVPYKVPELLQDDCLANYFACRYNERDALKATFKQPKQDRVDREITRIATLKTGFEKEDRNRPDINLFKYRQALWKAHAIAACGENLKGVDTKVQAMAPFKQLDVEKKANTLPNPEELEDEETARRIAAERRTAMERRIAMEKKILEAVKKWATPGIPPKPKELEDAEKAEAAAARQEDPLKNLLDKVKKKFWKKESKTKVSRSDREQTADTSRIFDLPEDSYGISVHEITLRKSPNSNPSSYMSYESDTKRHRLSDILSESTESKENPLTMNPEPDTIRYFHFPANNMHWIEVTIFTNLDNSSLSPRRKLLPDTKAKRPQENLTTGRIQSIVKSRQICSAGSSGHLFNMEVFMTRFMPGTVRDREAHSLLFLVVSPSSLNFPERAIADSAVSYSASSLQSDYSRYVTG